jgi:hypothetical protein
MLRWYGMPDPSGRSPRNAFRTEWRHDESLVRHVAGCNHSGFGRRDRRRYSPKDGQGQNRRHRRILSFVSAMWRMNWGGIPNGRRCLSAKGAPSRASCPRSPKRSSGIPSDVPGPRHRMLVAKLVVILAFRFDSFHRVLLAYALSVASIRDGYPPRNKNRYASQCGASKPQ